MVDEGNGRKRHALTHNDALVVFREASVLRGPTQNEFAKAAGMPGYSSAQVYYPKLLDIGWIALLEPENPIKGYVLTPEGELRYRSLKPEGERKGPTWPTE